MNARIKGSGQTYLTAELAAEAEAIAERERADREQAKREAELRAHRDKLGQWFTPRPLATKMVRSALRFANELQLGPDVTGRPLRVLDACAGQGAFALELLSYAAVHVTTVEIDPELSRVLKERAHDTCTSCDGTRESCARSRVACCPDCEHKEPRPFEVHTADFLEWSKGCLAGEFDLVISNPPFHLLRDVVSAASAIAAAVVVLGPASMSHGDKNALVHDSLAPKHIRDLLRRPKFSGSAMQPRSDHAVLFGVPHTPESLRRSRHSISYGVWRERWNDKALIVPPDMQMSRAVISAITRKPKR